MSQKPPFVLLHRKASSGMGELSMANSPKLSSEEIVEINGQFVRRDEKVLIERGGKFELVEACELKAILPPVQNGNGNGHSVAVLVDETKSRQTGLPPVNGRPKSAPVKSYKPRPPSTNRPVSASDPQTYRRKVGTKVFKLYKSSVLSVSRLFNQNDWNDFNYEGMCHLDIAS